MDKFGVDPNSIGRLEVGTESNLDRAKSVKSHLMQLFEPFGNTSISGVDNVNACFGGTAALMNSINWMESRDWDGRLAIVVAADIAIYEKGTARPTGGAGAVAMLIGPNAPIIFERGLSATFMSHSFDFCKPDPFSPYPVVDGKGSITSYLNALSICSEKIEKLVHTHTQQQVKCCDFFDYFVFHTPYPKIVTKSLNALTAHLDEKTRRVLFNEKAQVALKFSSILGNLYCASVYTNLLCLLSSEEDLLNRRVGIFSYGSGLASMLFSIKIVGSLNPIRDKIDISKMISNRVQISPKEFDEVLRIREECFGKAGWKPSAMFKDHHRPGVFLLDEVDDNFRRYYKCI